MGLCHNIIAQRNDFDFDKVGRKIGLESRVEAFVFGSPQGQAVDAEDSLRSYIWQG